MSEPLRVLCVDDERHILHTLARFCKNEGLQMLSASSAADALVLMEREAVDVVISDYQMPGMNGLEFLHRVHAVWPRVAGIIISGFVELPAVSRALQQGDIVGFMLKPWKREDLKNLLSLAAERGRVDDAKGVVLS